MGVGVRCTVRANIIGCVRYSCTELSVADGHFLEFLRSTTRIHKPNELHWIHMQPNYCTVVFRERNRVILRHT